MTATTVRNKFAQESEDDVFEELAPGALDETDDLEVFPVLLQSRDVRDLIEAAQKRGLSATGLARRLVRQYLVRTQDILFVTSMPAGENR
jgi:hypothetical protein